MATAYLDLRLHDHTRDLAARNPAPACSASVSLSGASDEDGVGHACILKLSNKLVPIGWCHCDGAQANTGTMSKVHHLMQLL